MSNIKTALHDHGIGIMERELSRLTNDFIAAGHDDVMSPDDYAALELSIAQLSADLFEAKIDAGYADPWFNTGLVVGDFI